MGCPSMVLLEDSLVFSIVCHDPDTGVLSDASSAPTWRLYEDETATPILTGSMAKLDDANTTGFYTEQIDCTAVNGFESRKSYTVYIEATVDSDTGGISYAFVVWDAAYIWTYAQRTLTSPAQSSEDTTAGSITRVRGDTWSIAITGLGDLTGWTVIDFTIKNRQCEVTDDEATLRIRLSEPGVVTDGLIRLNGADPDDLAAGSITVDVEVDGDITIAVDADKTAQLSAKTYSYDVQVIKVAVVTTLEKDTFTVTSDVTLATS